MVVGAQCYEKTNTSTGFLTYSNCIQLPQHLTRNCVFKIVCWMLVATALEVRVDDVDAKPSAQHQNLTYHP